MLCMQVHVYACLCIYRDIMGGGGVGRKRNGVHKCPHAQVGVEVDFPPDGSGRTVATAGCELLQASCGWTWAAYERREEQQTRAGLHYAIVR